MWQRRSRDLPHFWWQQLSATDKVTLPLWPE
jgi:hypothetical protein